MAHDVFVSYSQDDKQVADAVVARLEQESIRCWIAPRDITPGTSWGEAIVSAIAGSRVMVLVLSANSNRSRQVIREVQRAVADDVIILPFRIENIDPTGAMAYFLGTEHWLDALTSPVERHIDRLQRTVGVLLAGDPVGREDLDTPPAGMGRRKRKWLPYAIGATAVGIAICVTLALTLTGGGDEEGEAIAEPTTTTATTTTSTTTTTLPPVSLTEVGQYRPMDLDPADNRAPDSIYGIDLVGTTLIYANGLDGVTRASVGDPTVPMPLDTFSAYDAKEVAFDGEWVYALLGDHTGDLLIFNVDGSGGASMESTAASLSNLFVADGFLYVSTHDYVGILDVADPLSPEVVYEWETPDRTGNPATVFVAEDIGYFGAGWDGLYLFNVIDPFLPIALSHWPSPNWIIGINVVDDTAYVTMGSTGLAILDVADPTQPTLLGLVEVPGFASKVVVAHDHAFVSWFGESGGLGGVAVVDVSDPAEPVFLDTYGRFQAISGLEIVGNHIIVADEVAGLVTYEIEGMTE